jgi:hypothetical protein
MTTENATPGTTPDAEPVTPEAQQAEAKQAQEDLAAGFAVAHGDQPSAEPASEPPVAEPAKPEVVEPAKVLAGMTDAEIKQVFEKVPGLEKALNEEIRKVYGKFGELNGQLQKLQQGQPTRTFTAGALKRLNEEFPEIASMLAEDLTELMGAPAAPAAEAPAAKPADAPFTPDVKTLITEAVTQVREATEQRLLTVLHPDWNTVVKSPEFAAWMGTLPAEKAKKYGESDDAFVAAEAFTEFKAFKPKGQKPSARGKERLEQAITPDGDGAPPTPSLDDNAAFVQGFNSVRGRA